MWVEYPENKPDKAGYYMTYYYSFEQGDWFYKAIYYYNGEWQKWRRGLPELPVKAFVPSSHNTYYGSCVMNFEPNAAPCPFVYDIPTQ